VWFKHRAWIPIAWVLSAANVGAVWFAALPAEPAHATAHAALAVLFGVAAQRLAARRQARQRPSLEPDHDRMTRLEHAIDSMAIELERIGEGQRFVTKVLVEGPRGLERPSPALQPDAVPATRPRPNDE
jgi:hypothetical protein